MRDEDRGAVEVLERQLEHLHRFDVEVVRRLVEQQAVRPLQHEEQQLQARPLAARQAVERPPHLLVAEQELHQPRHCFTLRDGRRATDELERCRLRVVGAAVLRESAEADRRPGLPLALIQLELAGQDSEEHRLAGAVVTDDPDPLAAQHRQVDAGEHRGPTQLDSGVGELDHALPAARVRPKIQGDLAALERRPVDLLHPVDLPLLVPSLLDMPLVDDAARPVLEAADRLLEPCDLLLLRDVCLLLALQFELARDRVRRVVAGPHAHAAAVQLGDLRHGLVEQVAVVRHRDDGTIEPAHQLFHPLARLDVEMRLRLVEQQHIGIAQKTCCEADELPLAAREDARRLGEVVVAEPDLDEQGARPRLEAGPACGGPAVEQLFLPAEQASHAVQVGARSADPVLDTLELTLELVEVGPCRPQGHERVPVVALELLREVRDDEPTPLRHLAGVGVLVTGKNAKQRRLAAAVRTDHAHPHAGLDVEVEPVEDQPRAEALGDSACGEQSHRGRR